MSREQERPAVAVHDRLDAAMERLDDCELAGAVALGIARLAKRQAWTMSAHRVRALRTVLRMLDQLVRSKQA